MKDTLFIGGLCVLIIAAGLLLYFFGAPKDAVVEGAVPYTVLAEGSSALEVDTRTNYRIRSQEELDTLWTLIHGDIRPGLPAVDFEDSEVLAIFDGSHSTGGYRADVTAVVDSGLARTVYIRRAAPEEACITSSAETSPYQLIVLSKMRDGYALKHENTSVVTSCQ